MIMTNGLKNHMKNLEKSNDKHEKKNFCWRRAHDTKEEGKERKGLKILTPNKQLTKLQVLLAEIKAENNSYKLKNEIRQIV